VKRAAVDGNEAAALVAHKTSEVIAIYPITPASPMGELADAWSAAGQTNIWGAVPEIVEMQSEGGAAGAVHGALQAGALTTTFTASQGLLLMLPNMFKIAGELTPTVFHVAARTVATHALSIFGDHSDVMAARGTGFAFLCSSTVQEAQDLALVATAATLASRVPFVHFFDGFRTSHEINVIEKLSDEQIRALVTDELVQEHRARALTPERPVLRGTAQNPDVFFQAREAVSPYYAATPEIVARAMAALAEVTGRRYSLFDYTGAPDADRVVVAMGSAAETVAEVVAALNARGEKVGVLEVRLYRPFSASAFVAALPESARSIAVLDRSKDPAAGGEPLFLDVVAALAEQGRDADVIGGRYGLASKEFTPAMAAAVYAELERGRPRRHFTVGITDDVSASSLELDPGFAAVPRDVVEAVFYGLGSDGTVGANKNSVKILAEEAGLHAQGYFVYDSKKAGAVTVSHLRFGREPIVSPYLIESAGFVACHNFDLLSRLDVLSVAAPGATFLLNSPHGPDGVWDALPREVQEQIVAKRLRLFVVDAGKVARQAGLGARVNTVLQPCFFQLAGVLPPERAIAAIKDAIRRTYGKRGELIVERNNAAVDLALAELHEVTVPEQATAEPSSHAIVPPDASDFERLVTAELIAGRGDSLPVSSFLPDGTFPVGTARYEKRSLADELPVWDPEICIDCAKCALVCPHAAIRLKVFEPAALDGAPEAFKHKEWRGRDLPGKLLAVQVAPDDCTGCGLCIEICPARSKEVAKHKSLDAAPKAERLEEERLNWDFFLTIPELDRTLTDPATIKGSQLLEPLFEFSGACSGCGETPYLKLLTQMFGDRMLVANATGCSSIYGGNLPTTPWSANGDGRGPAWANSLFEDNAEFGLGMRLALDHQEAQARALVRELVPELARDLLDADQSDELGIAAQRARVADLKAQLREDPRPEAARLLSLADALVRRSVWIVGGDGWAYDIGFGGLDHVLASGRNVNVLVMDTEVYSNTGGQASKATPRSAVAKFAAAGKRTRKKDLGMIAAAYGDVYVAQIAMGADNAQTVKAIAEAEAYPGPALVIAYSHCIAHGFDLGQGMVHQKEAADSGYWPLYRYDPRADHPLQLDSRKPKLPLAAFAEKEARFAMLARSRPEEAARLAEAAQHDIDERWHLYEQLAGVDHDTEHATGNGDAAPGNGDAE
jgi:pyruvate-ferredoxin/flavodoxin oxidoreductase